MGVAIKGVGVVIGDDDVIEGDTVLCCANELGWLTLTPGDNVIGNSIDTSAVLG